MRTQPNDSGERGREGENEILLPGEYRCHGEDDGGSDRGQNADAARRVEVAGVQHEDPGQEEELRGEEGRQPGVAPLPRTLKMQEQEPK